MTPFIYLKVFIIRMYKLFIKLGPMQEDYILREIQKISVLLQRLVKMLVPVALEEAEKDLEMVRTELCEEIGMEPENIVEMELVDLLDKLKPENGFDIENAELLADLLLEYAQKAKDVDVKMYKRILDLYEYVNETTKTYSFNREAKIMEASKMISDKL